MRWLGCLSHYHFRNRLSIFKKFGTRYILKSGFLILYTSVMNAVGAAADINHYYYYYYYYTTTSTTATTTTTTILLLVLLLLLLLLLPPPPPPPL